MNIVAAFVASIKYFRWDQFLGRSLRLYISVAVVVVAGCFCCCCCWFCCPLWPDGVFQVSQASPQVRRRRAGSRMGPANSVGFYLLNFSYCVSVSLISAIRVDPRPRPHHIALYVWLIILVTYLFFLRDRGTSVYLSVVHATVGLHLHTY